MSDGHTNPDPQHGAAPTPQERAAWQAACDAATPGPWPDTMADINRHTPAMGAVYAGIGPVHEEDTEAAYNRACYDSAFIALARTALPRLLAENAALRAQVARLQPFREMLYQEATQPPLPDADAPQQLGLLEDQS